MLDRAAESRAQFEASLEEVNRVMEYPTATVDEKRYPVERVMLGTSWVGRVMRVVLVSQRRHAARDPLHEVAVLERWAARQWRRLYAATWHAVGEVEISYSEHQTDLFLRNLGAYRVDQRAIRRDEDWDRAMGDKAFDTRADEVAIAIVRGELPKPPPLDDAPLVWTYSGACPNCGHTITVDLPALPEVDS